MPKTVFATTPRYFIADLPNDLSVIQTILRVEAGVLRRDPTRKPYSDGLLLPVSPEILVGYKALRDSEIFSGFTPEAHIDNFRELAQGNSGESEIEIPFSLARDIYNVHFQKAHLPEVPLKGLEPLTVINLMVSFWGKELDPTTRRVLDERTKSALDGLANQIVDEAHPDNLDLTVPRRRRDDLEVSRDLLLLGVDRIKNRPGRQRTTIEEGIPEKNFEIAKDAVAAFVTLVSQHKLKPNVRGFLELYRRGLFPLTLMLTDMPCIMAMETLTGYSAEQLMESIAIVDVSHSLLRTESIENLLIAQELIAIDRNDRKRQFTENAQAAKAEIDHSEEQHRALAEQAASAARIAEARSRDLAKQAKQQKARLIEQAALKQSLEETIEQVESLEGKAREYFSSFRKVTGFKNGENFARYAYTRGLRRKFPELKSMLTARIVLGNLENNLRHIELLKKIALQFQTEGVLDAKAIKGLQQLVNQYEAITEEYFAVFNFKKLKDRDVMPALDHSSEEMARRGLVKSMDNAWANVLCVDLEPSDETVDLPLVEAGSQQLDVSPKIYGIPEAVVLILREAPGHWSGKLLHDVSGIQQPLPNGSSLDSAALVVIDALLEDFRFTTGSFPSFTSGTRRFELQRSRDALSAEEGFKLDGMLNRSGLGTYLGIEPFKSFRSRMQELP